MAELCDFVIVGAGPAAHAAATAFRETGGTGTVALIADEHRAPYRRPPLTKEWLRGDMDAEDLALGDPDVRPDGELRICHAQAVSLDCDRRTVALDDGRELEYGTCLLACGARPSRMPIPGGDLPGVLTLRTLADARRLLARLRERARVAVLGSGFIGCEAAASLRRRGTAVTLVSDEDAPQARRLGDDVAGRIGGWLREAGVVPRLGDAVTRIDSDGTELCVTTDGCEERADVVLMAGGAVPRAELAQRAGLTMDGGRIAVDASMRTSRKAVLAAGDVAAAVNSVAGARVPVEHWGDALAQGRVAGAVAAGEGAQWDRVPGFWSDIGGNVIKYAAWGGEFASCEFIDHGDGAFSADYRAGDGRLIGVLAHRSDDHYERGRDRIAEEARG